MRSLRVGAEYCVEQAKDRLLECDSAELLWLTLVRQCFWGVSYMDVVFCSEGCLLSLRVADRAHKEDVFLGHCG